MAVHSFMREVLTAHGWISNDRDGWTNVKVTTAQLGGKAWVSIEEAYRIHGEIVNNEGGYPKPGDTPKVLRHPVDYDYECINPEFLKWMAMIGPYAKEKYGDWAQYTAARLTGEKSPMNHIQEHKRAFQMGEPYERFDKDPRWHLVAIAYNAMMEFFYTSKFGLIPHPLRVVVRGEHTPFGACGDPSCPTCYQQRCICGGSATEGPPGMCSNCKLPLKAPLPPDLRWLGWMCNECGWQDRSSHFERTDGEPCPQCVRENRNGKILSCYKKV